MSKGYIYFIQQGLDGQIKIGYSQDPKDRLKTLQTSNPRELRLLLTLQGNEDYERKLHKQFERHKLKGEWFEPHEDVLIFIENNKSGDVALERIENTILGLQSEIEELKRENVELKKTISNFRKESEFDLFLKSQKLSIHSDDHENHLEADFYIKKIHSIDLNWRFRGGELGVYGDLDIPMLGNESEKFYLFDGSNNYFIIDFFAKIMNLNIQDNPRFFAETLWDAESDLEIAKLYFLEYF